MDNKSVTFSCGLTGDYPNTLSNVEFFNEADQALYYAKSNGKNQTVIYTSLERNKGFIFKLINSKLPKTIKGLKKAHLFYNYNFREKWPPY